LRGKKDDSHPQYQDDRSPYEISKAHFFASKFFSTLSGEYDTFE
jgi:hypothetical protein